MQWTADEDALIRQMVTNGTTCGQLMEVFGRGKNSCIGRVHRLGLVLTAHKPPDWTDGALSQTRAAQRMRDKRAAGFYGGPRKRSGPRKSPAERPQQAPRPANAPPPPKPVIQAPHPPPPKPVPPPPVVVHTCAFPLTSGRPWRFCDRPCAKDQTGRVLTYCGEHCARAYKRAA